MKDYVVYFEVYNKKLKTTVRARNPERAAEVVRGMIEIKKIEEVKLQPTKKDIDQMFKEIYKDAGSLFDEISDIFKKKK